jgi:hypothetical protein
LDSIIIKIPSQVLFSQVHFYKIFLLALLISMGTTLFSCADRKGNKQKIDGVEVVDDTSKVEYITNGELAIYKDSLNQSSALIIAEIEFAEGQHTTSGLIIPTPLETVADSVKQIL